MLLFYKVKQRAYFPDESLSWKIFNNAANIYFPQQNYTLSGANVIYFNERASLPKRLKN